MIIFFDIGNLDFWDPLKTKPSNPAQSKDGRFIGDMMSSAATLFNAPEILISEILNKFLTRSGIGFDLHKYEDGSGMILGGYSIKCDYKIIAHSDGDVLLHSIADSILGASGLGDIGKYFSDQDDKNKNLDSSEIIKFCLEKLNELNL